MRCQRRLSLKPNGKVFQVEATTVDGKKLRNYGQKMRRGWSSKREMQYLKRESHAGPQTMMTWRVLTMMMRGKDGRDVDSLARTVP
jgi:hypothetical protein